MGIPSGNMLVKIGYKKTALIAMAVGFIGLFIQYISICFKSKIIRMGSNSSFQRRPACFYVMQTKRQEAL